MGEAGKVQGAKLIELFDQLIAEKIIISMNVVGALNFSGFPHSQRPLPCNPLPTHGIKKTRTACSE